MQPVLPEAYEARMKELLGAEYPLYLESLSRERVESLRINTGKWSAEEAERVLPWELAPVPWEPAGRYLLSEVRAAKHPAYAAGLYYIQEASAMTPAAVLPLSPGDRVMDLCAAPGGKSTQLAARMQGGVLYANDISASRARSLLKNLEMAGAESIFVTAEEPGKLADRLGPCFQAVLVDAPCSGEGMIRKDAAILRDWRERGPAYYQPLQAEILDVAAGLVAPGGHLLYSTCTFSREENEGNVEDFLRRHGDFTLAPIPLRPGFSQGLLPGTVRLWPQRVRGEGQFLALFTRDGVPEQNAGNRAPEAVKKKQSGGRGEKSSLPSFLEQLSSVTEGRELVRREERWYAIPRGERILPGIRYLRTGLLLGEENKNRFAPSQALAMALSPDAYPDTVSFSWEDERVTRYLRGETVDAEGADLRGMEGTVLVCVDRFPLGWAKRRGTALKNKLNPAWRVI